MMTTIISIHYSLRGGTGDPDAAASLTALLALADHRRVAGQA